jgi:hypothetical protein
MENGMVHKVGDVKALTNQITLLHENSAVLPRLKAAALRSAPEFTWNAAGEKLLEAYRGILASRKS